LEPEPVNAAGSALSLISFRIVLTRERRAGMVTQATSAIPEILFRGVTKRYGNAIALENISLAIDRAEFVTFLGPSGCGKSTLLKLVSGLSPVSDGKVEVNGMTPANARELMSFIFQDATLLPWRTVEKTVGLGLEWSMRRGRSAKIAWRKCWSL
jgi:NitT/TauT family transport system ATP-binding protein